MLTTHVVVMYSVQLTYSETLFCFTIFKILDFYIYPSTSSVPSSMQTMHHTCIITMTSRLHHDVVIRYKSIFFITLHFRIAKKFSECFCQCQKSAVLFVFCFILCGYVVVKLLWFGGVCGRFFALPAPARL